MSRVAILQNFWCENAGVFEPALVEAGHQVTNIHLYRGRQVPSPGDFDAWIVMGGPMNVDEVHRFAFLDPERELLARVIAADRPLMGICLGAQLIARAAGARVYAKQPKEIGLFPIELTAAAGEDPLFQLFSSPQEVFQWHGDTFDLPAGAVLLAKSERFENQAFRLGRRVYALQFHLECTATIIDDLTRAFGAELSQLPAGEDFSKHRSQLEEALVRQNVLARQVITRWAKMLDRTVEE